MSRVYAFFAVFLWLAPAYGAVSPQTRALTGTLLSLKSSATLSTAQRQKVSVLLRQLPAKPGWPLPVQAWALPVQTDPAELARIRAYLDGLPDPNSLNAEDNWKAALSLWETMTSTAKTAVTPPAEGTAGQSQLQPYSANDERQAAAPVQNARTYIFAKPLRLTSRLNLFWRLFHYVFEATIQGSKGYGAYWLSGNLHAAWAVVAWHLPYYFPWVVAQSMGDLHYRTRFWTYINLRNLGPERSIDKINVLTANSVDFRGPVAFRSRSRGFVVVKAKGPLSLAYSTLGDALEIEDPASAKLELRLVYNGRQSASRQIPFMDALDGKPLPKTAVEEWRGYFRDHERLARVDFSKWKKGWRYYARPILEPFSKPINWVARNFFFDSVKDLSIQATLVEADEHGGARTLGAFLHGKTVLNRLNITKWRPLAARWAVDIAQNWWKGPIQRLLAKLGKQPEIEKSIPVDNYDILVKKNGDHYAVPESTTEFFKRPAYWVWHTALLAASILLFMLAPAGR